MAAKAQREVFETISDMQIERWFKSGQWSYDLMTSDGKVAASVWHIGAGNWGNKIHGKGGFNMPIKGEAAAVEWLRGLVF